MSVTYFEEVRRFFGLPLVSEETKHSLRVCRFFVGKNLLGNSIPRLSVSKGPRTEVDYRAVFSVETVYPHSGQRVSYHPFDTFLSPKTRVVFSRSLSNVRLNPNRQKESEGPPVQSKGTLTFLCRKLSRPSIWRYERTRERVRPFRETSEVWEVTLK